MTRITKIATGAGLLAAGFVTLSAFGGWHHGAMTPERAQQIATKIVDHMLDDVKATDEQRAQINAIKDQRVRDTVAFMQANKAVHAALLKEWEADKPDAKAVHAAIDQRIDALRTMAHQMADDALEVHEILKPEQRAQITEHIKQHFGGDSENTDSTVEDRK